MRAESRPPPQSPAACGDNPAGWFIGSKALDLMVAKRPSLPPRRRKWKGIARKGEKVSVIENQPHQYATGIAQASRIRVQGMLQEGFHGNRLPGQEGQPISYAWGCDAASPEGPGSTCRGRRLGMTWHRESTWPVVRAASVLGRKEAKAAGRASDTGERPCLSIAARQTEIPPYKMAQNSFALISHAKVTFPEQNGKTPACIE
ncbi:uncharacterized protein LOC143834855 [Paroedura picta]|uniref:uncharacterized protein LOC143834855 n=1 Tax=Paroedura picta TaxID=143630 RepID=UPI00405656D3